jgi:hypothetical protein
VRLRKLRRRRPAAVGVEDRFLSLQRQLAQRLAGQHSTLERFLGALADQRPLFLRHSGVNVEHERVHVQAERGDHKRDLLGHQAGDEMDVAAQPIEPGEGLLGRAMCRIFGQHGRHISSPEHLTGKFNSHLQQCCFLFADEAAAPQDRKAEGALKRLVTEPTLFIEPKGVDSFEVPNRLSVMMASNHNWVVPASEKERRYVAQDVADDHQQDEAWFEPIYKEMRNGGLEAMLYDLLARNLGDWHPRRIVFTAALGRQQVESLSPLDQWWFELLQSGVLAGTLSGARKPLPNVATSNAFEVEVEEEEEIEDSGFYGGTRMRKRKRMVPRPGLYDQARWISPKLKGVSDTALGTFLGDHGCMHAWPAQRRGWRFPALADCRDEWVKRFPHTVWAEPSPADWTFGEDDDE